MGFFVKDKRLKFCLGFC